MFFFGSDLDQNNDPLVGNGSEENHCHLIVSTKKMLRFMDENLDPDYPSIFHIDSTYKITKNGFPLVVLAEIDFIVFYENLCQIAKKLNIRFRPSYICQDGSDSMRNAAKTVFGEKIEILMCFFHVKNNVRKSKLISRDQLPVIFEDINKMHETKSESEFSSRKKFSKWKRNKFDKFADYFEKEWIRGHFSNWQIFNTPPGYSSSNSIIESFNRTVKTSFTLKKRLSVLKSLEMLENKCKFYCNLNTKLNNDPKVKKKLIDKAHLFGEKCYKKVKEDLYQVKVDRVKYLVDISDLSFQCVDYFIIFFCINSN
ncbi:unnamed protein product [Brachionus calyciflorus]|uniref:MULE transposase domain-containing protein n=1 Tax=Brachionus calyciflorus TaxID=104777 RepID=A0A813WF43_9BILA|nr:unnamed protein product [Brachionus calyciflorus]